MAVSHPNADLFMEYMQVWNGGDRDQIASYWSDDGVVHYGGDNQFSGSYRGREAILDLIVRLQGAVGQLVLEPLDVLADDRYVMAIARVWGHRDEADLDVRTANALRVGPDRRFTEGWYSVSDQAAVDRYFG